MRPAVNEDIATSSTEDLTHDVRVRHEKLTLKLVDKEAIKLGGELNDKHIQMAQYLVKVQFPVTGGLESTLLLGKRKSCCTVNTVQIIYCKKRYYWITGSTKLLNLERLIFMIPCLPSWMLRHGALSNSCLA